MTPIVRTPRRAPKPIALCPAPSGRRSPCRSGVSSKRAAPRALVRGLRRSSGSACLCLVRSPSSPSCSAPDRPPQPRTSHRPRTSRTERTKRPPRTLRTMRPPRTLFLSSSWHSGMSATATGSWYAAWSAILLRAARIAIEGLLWIVLNPFKRCARMSRMVRAVPIAVMLAAALVVSLHGQQGQPPQTPARPSGDEQGFRFKRGVELINVPATVSDVSGRFVSGLRPEDFVVYEDNQPVQVTHFSAERVPVSLGIALDTSGSMAGEKIQAAQSALDRFLFDLLDRQDEIFLYRFSNDPVLLQSWTTDRPLLSRAIGRVVPNGGTAMYDTVAEAIPLAQRGQHLKKALVVISDGNDTASRTSIVEVKQLIRESEVLVYAIGIDNG